ELKATGIPCFALSNMERETYPVRRARFPFMSWFDGAVISGFEGVAKPDPQIFETLLGRYDLKPAATIFVDDSTRNVDASRALGFIGVQYRSAQELRQEFRTHGLPIRHW
ncbi:MAG: HAD-IA family hydrolase, partial [Actinobacteria bacterium]|nr:HAD-IA family hydrolase [Actinomycetota bacterium]